MTKQQYIDGLHRFDVDVTAGRLTSAQAEAKVLLRGLGDSLPYSVRSILWVIENGTEMPDRARDVLMLVRDLMLENKEAT